LKLLLLTLPRALEKLLEAVLMLHHPHLPHLLLMLLLLTLPRGGGRMLKGPGDGMSDDIPATIANKQPAKLANEEFVVPADVVSHLGNGSSEAGAKVLYKMMDRVRQARTGTKKQGKQINPEKYLA
jgi:hypothetical protein